MPIINEQIVRLTRPNDRYDRRWRTDWMLYRQSHLLARDFYKIKKHRDSDLLRWVLSHVKDKPTVILDSFYPSLINNFTQADYYEYADQQILFNDSRVKFFTHVAEVTEKYDQILVLGALPFKYQTTEQYVNAILSYFPIMKEHAVMLVCLPMLHHCFHRLKYQHSDVIDQIDKRLHTVNYRIETYVVISNNYFLKLSSLQ